MEDNNTNITPEQALEVLKGNENFVVRSKAEDQSFVQSHVDQALGNRLTQFDENIFSITGISKAKTEDGKSEKTGDYIKRSISKYMSENKELKLSNKQMKEQMEALKLSSSGQEEFEKKAQEFVKEKATLIESFEQDKVQLKNQYEQTLKTVQVKNAIDTFSPKMKNIEGIDYVKRGIEQEMLSLESRINDEGQTIYYENGKPIMSDKDGHFLSTGEILANKLSPYLKETPVQTGTGGPGEGTATPQNVPSFNNKVEIDNYLKSEGFKTGSLEWGKKRNELIKGNNL